MAGTTATATATAPLPQDKFAKFIGMTGAQIVKEVLIERGVTQVFGYPGKASPVCMVWPSPFAHARARPSSLQAMKRLSS